MCQDTEQPDPQQEDSTTMKEQLKAEEVNPSQEEPSAESDETTTKQREADHNGEEKQTFLQRLYSFYNTNSFLIQIAIAILLARAYPPLGAEYLYPKITATWIVVIFIFVMAGLSLKTEEFTKAFKQLKFNLVVQLFSFGVVSSGTYGFSRLLLETKALTKDLADGMVVCACLPMTINMVLILTKAANGDEAAAIFNAAFGNLVGVFLSPLLILGYLGVSGNVNMVDIFIKLAVRVLLPIFVGQILQKTCKPLVEFHKNNKNHFKTVQQLGLVFIVYTVFCRTFSSDIQSPIGDVFLMSMFLDGTLTLRSSIDVSHRPSPFPSFVSFSLSCHVHGYVLVRPEDPVPPSTKATRYGLVWMHTQNCGGGHSINQRYLRRQPISRFVHTTTSHLASYAAGVRDANGPTASILCRARRRAPGVDQSRRKRRNEQKRYERGRQQCCYR